MNKEITSDTPDSTLAAQEHALELTSPPSASGDTGDPGDKNRGARDKLLALTHDLPFFVSTDDKTCATIDIGGSERTFVLRGPEFKGWLGRRYYEAHHRTAPPKAIDEVLDHLDGVTRLAGATPVDVFVRVGRTENAVYLDLANDRNEVVEVTRDGWRVMTNPPVKFRRTSTMLPLPTPTRGGSLAELPRYINVREGDFPKAVGFLLGAMRGKAPYAHLEVLGQHGSAKTFTCRILQRMIDPRKAEYRAAPKNEQDVAIALTKAHITMYDNISHISDAMSDVLCRASTGGGYSTRTLYTDDGEVVFEYQRPVMLNGIADIASRADLLERTLTVDLPVIDLSRRRSERDLLAEFEAAQPALLGALLDAVACALRNWDAVKDKYRWPRLADFARWVTAAEEALGWEPGTFIGAMQANARSSAERSLADDQSLVDALRTIAGQGAGWTGTATQLLEKLNCMETRDPKWPKQPNSLSGKLNRIAPPLRTMGIEILHFHQGAESTKFITVRRVPQDIARIDRTDCQPQWSETLGVATPVPGSISGTPIAATVGGEE